MNDKTTTVDDLKRKIEDFGNKRGWSQTENAKDLVMALTVEASELMEIFQWIHSDEADSLKNNEKEFIHLKEEIADVFWYLMRVCSHFDIDLAKSVEEKEVKNALKYPLKKISE